ncbi:MAG: hypothetical protein ACTSRG_26805 [Candidatus Helarchaeota archaeon]
MPTNNSSLDKNLIEFIKERDQHYIENIEHIYSRISIVLSLSSVLLALFVFVVKIESITFLIFLFPLCSLFLTIFFSLKAIFPFQFEDYNNYGIKKVNDIKNIAELIKKDDFKITLDHYLVKMTKHYAQRNKRSKDLIIVILIFTNFVVVLPFSFILYFWHIKDILIILILQVLPTLIYSIIITIIYKKYFKPEKKWTTTFERIFKKSKK